MTDPHQALRLASSALNTIDVQRDFLSEAPYGVPGTTEVLPAVLETIEAFRAAGRPIVHVVRLYEPGGSDADLVRRTLLAGGVDLVAPHSAGSQLAKGMLPGAEELDPELLRAGGVQQVGPYDHVIYKPRWGAFYRTPLEAFLRERDVDSLVVVGCNLPNCPRATLIEASERDYRVGVVPEALSQTTQERLEEMSRIGVELLDLRTLCQQLEALTAE
jgi:nicotinamidase-related amidase